MSLSNEITSRQRARREIYSTPSDPDMMYEYEIKILHRCLNKSKTSIILFSYLGFGANFGHENKPEVIIFNYYYYY